MSRRTKGLLVVFLLAVVGIGWLIYMEGADDRALAAYSDVHADEAALAVEVLGAMPPELTETSGVAISRRDAGVIWSHNDSGDTPTLYRIDRTGRLTGTFELGGAEAFDWEAMDIGPCLAPSTSDDVDGSSDTEVDASLEGSEDTSPESEPSRDCLYAADVGDNGLQRESVTVYVVAEPGPERSDGILQGVRALHLSYPDGARDSEAVAVPPEGGLILITKGRTPDIDLHWVSPSLLAESIGSPDVLPLPPGVRLPIEPDWQVGRAVTGAAVHPDGHILAVRTYSEIRFYQWPLGDEPVEAARPCHLGSTEPQGEAIAFDTDGHLLLTSEDRSGIEGMLLRVSCAGVTG